MPAGLVQNALASRLPLPEMRARALLCPAESQAVPMSAMPFPGLADPGHHLRLDQAALAPLDAGHLPGHPVQGRYLLAQSGQDHRCLGQGRPATQAQTGAGHEKPGRPTGPAGPAAHGRCLLGRQEARRQERAGRFRQEPLGCALSLMGYMKGKSAFHIARPYLGQ